jgi:hypothetical protein
MQPCIADAEQLRDAGQFAARDIAAIEEDDPARAADRLLAAAAGPGVLFSCSHGAGAPSGGWTSPDRRRALQGALCLGGDTRLEADAVARAPFLPGGVWLMFACFGAGTPRQSAFEPWLLRLRQHGDHDDDLAPVLASLPAEGEPPFLAALPQAALANPDGPLAIIGHLDLAWSYGFQDLDKMSRGERHRRFHELVAQLVKGTRVGLALGGSLMRARNQVQTEIAIATADEARAGHELAEQRARLGHRWMVLQDLDGYIALGDPAARIAPRPRASDAMTAAAAGIRPASVELVSPAAAAGSARAASAEVVSPAAAAGSTRDAPGVSASDIIAAGTSTSRAVATGASATDEAATIDPRTIQAAVHDLLADRATLAEIAARHGVAADVAARWRRVYTEAGLRAVTALLATAGGSSRGGRGEPSD